MADLLFLAHRVPYPPDRGDKIRSFNILKHLSERHRVHLAAFADDERDEAAARAIPLDLGQIHVERRTRSKAMSLAMGLPTRTAASVVAFAHRGMARAVDRVLGEEPIDKLYVYSGQMAQYAPDDRPFVMDFVDMDSQKFADYAAASRPPMRWLWKREAGRLFAFEREAANRAVVSLFVSGAEAELFRAKSGLPGAKVKTLENGIDLDRYVPGAAPAGAPLVVFTGQMDYPPNVAAVTGFARDAMPAIRKLHPDARFAIVGRNPDPAVLALAGKGVEVTGEVADVRPWLANAHVVVAPLRIARGIQNKVLEAMAMGRPVVASPQAFEGIDAEPGRDLLVANGPQAEAQAVLGLLADPVRAEAIGAAARTRMETRYAWSACLAPLDALLAHL